MSSAAQLTGPPISLELLANPVQRNTFFKSVFDMEPSNRVGRAGSF